MKTEKTENSAVKRKLVEILRKETIKQDQNTADSQVKIALSDPLRRANLLRSIV